MIDPFANANIPRLVLAAASSDAGKTTVALGLTAAFRKRGLVVSAAKSGPDFIDAAHLARAAGRPARNLDAFLAPEDAVVGSFARGAADADLAIVEGAMGLFDGRHGTGEGSSAHVARLLAAPVILVLDCAKASSTIGAIAYGLARFDPRIRVAGAILNRVASTRHAETVTDAVRSAGVTVFGVLRRDERIGLPSRHLGLVEPGAAGWDASLAAVTEALERDIDLDAILACARSAPPLATTNADHGEARHAEARVRIAIARDEAFWFYDEASLETLALAGAEFVPYAPLRDSFPADVAGAFIGGGYPELHAEALAANVAARDGLRRAIADGMPTYAECGGLMYLGEALEAHGTTHAMVGAVPAISTLGERRSALRYVEARALGTGPLFADGAAVRGHEFHYSRTRYAVERPAFAIDDEREGFRSAHVHASYVHVHLGAHPSAARAFIAQARAFASVP